MLTRPIQPDPFHSFFTNPIPPLPVPLCMSKNPTVSRREVLTSAAAFSGLAALSNSALAAQPTKPASTAPCHALLTPAELGWDAAKGEYTLPALPYAHDALEPHLDAQTMEIHHTKHHAGYVKGLNTALTKLAEIRAGSGDASLIKHWSRELSFHGAGHVNHAIFWVTMAPASAGGGGEPTGPLADAINRDFGSFSAFSTHFQAAANAVEGSGWAWLVHEPTAGRLLVLQGEKQQDMMLTGATPLLGVDVWEHAYYLRYQNKRADYVKAFMNTVNWSRVGQHLAVARGV